jgi:hypothetical protein
MDHGGFSGGRPRALYCAGIDFAHLKHCGHSIGPQNGRAIFNFGHIPHTEPKGKIDENWQ